MGCKAGIAGELLGLLGTQANVGQRLNECPAPCVEVHGTRGVRFRASMICQYVLWACGSQVLRTGALMGGRASAYRGAISGLVSSRVT